MAVGTPYGKGPYNVGPYARYSAAGRPYGVGAYGVGPYEGWGGNTFDVAAATGIRFSVAAEPRLDHELYAVTGITFSVQAWGMQLAMQPWAVTEIVFSVQAHLAWNWDAEAVTPCEPGTWQPAALCETGTWSAPPGCTPGSWTPARLT